jgi:hypothetical protein
MLQAQCLHKSQLTNLHHLLGGMLALPWRGWVGWRARLTWPWRRAEGAEFLSISKHTQPAMRVGGGYAQTEVQRASIWRIERSRCWPQPRHAVQSLPFPFAASVASTHHACHVVILVISLQQRRTECNSSPIIRPMQNRRVDGVQLLDMVWRELDFGGGSTRKSRGC